MGQSTVKTYSVRNEHFECFKEYLHGVLPKEANVHCTVGSIANIEVTLPSRAKSVLNKISRFGFLL